MTYKFWFHYKRQNTRINIDEKMRRRGCGEAAESWRHDLEKERKGGDGWEQKAGRRLSSVSYISRLNESVQKSELSDQ